MRTAYKVLAYIIALEVVVQSMSMVYASAGLGKWVEDGGVLDKAVMESDDSPFPEVVGFMIHGINGMMVIPILAVILLLLSFFTKLPGAVKFAGVVVLLVALQVTLGILGHSIPALGALHGLNALLLLGASIHAGRRAQVSSVTTRQATEPELV